MTGAAGGDELVLRARENHHSLNAVRLGRNYATA
jgi:hypothetical protein